MGCGCQLCAAEFSRHRRDPRHRRARQRHGHPHRGVLVSALRCRVFTSSTRSLTSSSATTPRSSSAFQPGPHDLGRRGFSPQPDLRSVPRAWSFLSTASSPTRPSSQPSLGHGDRAAGVGFVQGPHRVHGRLEHQRPGLVARPPRVLLGTAALNIGITTRRQAVCAAEFSRHRRDP